MLDSRVAAYEFDEASSEIADRPELLRVLQRFLEPFEIVGVFVADMPIPGESFESSILLRGWSEKFIEQYISRDYIRDDPIARLVALRNQPYVWSEACEQTKLTPRQQQILRDYRRHGLFDGVTIPIHGALVRNTGVFFATMRRQPSMLERGVLDSIARTLLARIDAIRVANGETEAADSIEIPQLAARELLCLQWGANGKTSWEIGRMLDLSERTIDQYMQNAIRKLGLSTRSEAIAVATLCGLIRPHGTKSFTTSQHVE